MTTGCGGQELGHDQNFPFEQVLVSDSSAMPRKDDFVTRAEAQAMVDEALLRQQLIFDMQMKEAKLMFRKQKQELVLSRFHRESDKRAMKFNLDLQSDMEDLFAQLSKLKLEDGETLKEVEGNEAIYKSFAQFTSKWYQMVKKKLQKEAESYHVANTALGGWETEKIFNEARHSVFRSEQERDEWYDLPELSVEEREKKARRADRDFVYSLKRKHCDDDNDFDELYFDQDDLE